jgi:hypothetical protein
MAQASVEYLSSIAVAGASIEPLFHCSALHCDNTTLALSMVAKIFLGSLGWYGNYKTPRRGR